MYVKQEARRELRFFTVATFAALSAAALLCGCGGRRGSSAADGGRTGAATPELPPGQPHVAGEAVPSVEAWAQPEKLPQMQVRPLTEGGIRQPADDAELVRWLHSKKVDDRIFALMAAWKTLPAAAVVPLGELAARDAVLGSPAVQVLAKYPDPQGVTALLAAASSRHAAARLAAMRGLGTRKGGPGSPVEAALLRRLRADRDWRVRAAAAAALRRSCGGSLSPAATAALEALVADREQFYPLRLECAAALARCSSDKGWDALRAAALGPAEDGAVLAVGLAAETGGEPAASILSAALESRRVEVWGAAVRGMRLLPRLEAMEALSGKAAAGGEAAHRAALALAAHEGRRALPEVLTALREGSAPVREAACFVLADVAGPDGAAALEGKLRQAGEKQQVRLAAAACLGMVAGPAEVLALRGVVENEADAAVRSAARDALRLAEARLSAGAGAVSEAGAERMAFARWELMGFLGSGPSGCRLRDEKGNEKVYRVGEPVVMGYRLARLLGAGDASAPLEAVMAGPAALRSDLLRAVLVKGDRAVVLVKVAVVPGG